MFRGLGCSDKREQTLHPEDRNTGEDLYAEGGSPRKKSSLCLQGTPQTSWISLVNSFVGKKIEFFLHGSHHHSFPEAEFFYRINLSLRKTLLLGAWWPKGNGGTPLSRGSKTQFLRNPFFSTLVSTKLVFGDPRASGVRVLVSSRSELDLYGWSLERDPTARF